MENNDNVVRKGFRQTALPTKGEVMEQNKSLIGDLTQKVNGMQRQLEFMGQLLSQVAQGQRMQGMELNALSTLESSAVSSEAAVEEGNHVMIDYFGKLLNEDGTEGAAFEGGFGANFVILSLGSESLIPGFEAQLKGMKEAEFKTIDVTFPENYGAKELSGKKARFAVQIRKIYKPLEQSKVLLMKHEHDMARMAEKQAETAAKEAAASQETV